jgi:phenylalanyl-tRNA synthetase beta chain
MNISYNWLRSYINKDIEIEKLSTTLTDIGLEVGKIEKFESIKGGLEGLVVGEVIECKKHENSDHLSVTLTEVADGEVLPIVCGAPNVAKGQKVIVATVGTKLYTEEGEEFLIKKSKIRGELSMGMICAEDEIGVGQSHDGIMVLPNDVKTGTPAKEYFNIEEDYTIEVDLTPNRIDGASHVGVARDLAAFFRQTDSEFGYSRPSVEEFKVDNNSKPVAVNIENEAACNRYVGLTLSNVQVKESPEWLQNRLKAIGMNPINNIVDITNFVMMETGQPLHAFDYNKVEGQQINVMTLEPKTKFVTLDSIDRELHENDLMICNSKEPMCFAGVLGGLESGTTESTTDIFLESAYFNPVFVRKTARRHGINTDSSFRFERGIDPNGQVYAIKRAALLMKELAGAEISSEITDLYPNKIDNFKFDIEYSYINNLIGEEIPKDRIKNILENLEVQIHNETEDTLSIEVPAYRVDVQRPADVVEDILRIYGYNTVAIPTKLNSAIVLEHGVNKHKLQNIVSDFLSSNGYYEVMNNSLTKEGYYKDLQELKYEDCVKLVNPLSSDLGVMRRTLLFGMLENLIYNVNRQKQNLNIYEFGKSYFMTSHEAENPVEKYGEKEHYGLMIYGNQNNFNWQGGNQKSDFFILKERVETLLKKVNIDVSDLKVVEHSTELIQGLAYYKKKSLIAEVGLVKKSIAKQFDLKDDVFYADIKWDECLKLYTDRTYFKELPKFPEVTRDLSLLINTTTSFADLSEVAKQVEKKILKNVSIIDVYEGKGVEDGKKSYTMNFTFRSEQKTLTSKQIDKVMDKMIKTYQTKFDAVLR